MTARITVAICTRNGERFLEDAIRSVLEQTAAVPGSALLVVDNASTDATARVAQAQAASGVPLRYVREEQPGLGFARNRAIAETESELLAFIDDDARLLPGYLEALAQVYAEEPGLAAAGGPIEVGWLGPVPDWYEPTLDPLFNRLDHASYRMDLRYPRILFGTNMAFRVETLRELGGFRTDLKGPDGRVTAEADDEDILLRIETRGAGRIVWEPALRVRHYIQPERLTPAHILEKARRTGYARARIERAYPGHGGISRGIAGLGDWALRKVFGRGRGPITDRAQLETALGYLQGWRAG